ncbi:MAG: M67 family metallopeptidase [Oscillospiraceae bacterium]
MIVLTMQQYGQIVHHALQGFPNEACGLLAGEKEGGSKVVKKVYLLDNQDQSPTHFSISPAQQLEAVRDMRRLGYVPLGNFHSHPETPSRPSEEDKRLALDPQASYLILSRANKEEPVLKSFSIEGQRSAEEILIILPAGA